MAADNNNFNRTIPVVHGLDAPGNILRFILRQYDYGDALSRRKPGRPVLAIFPETPEPGSNKGKKFNCLKQRLVVP